MTPAQSASREICSTYNVTPPRGVSFANRPEVTISIIIQKHFREIVWTRVEDELPRDKQICIVWHCDTPEPVVARYIGGRQFHDFFKNWVPTSHWMAWPEAPVTEQ